MKSGNKKPRSMTTPSPHALSPLTLLPHALVRSIFTYAMVPSEHRGIGQSHISVPDELKTLALVSHEWNEYARDVGSAIGMRKLTISRDGISVVKTRRDLLELRRRVTLRRAFLRELEFRDDHRQVLLSLPHWCSVLSLTPQLEVVNAKWANRGNTEYLADIVRAARGQCPKLRSLQLPSLQPTRFGRVSESPHHTQLLVDAVLGQETRASDLRDLRLPISFLKIPDAHEMATEYLTKICEIHPRIEKLDGFTGLMDQRDRLECEEQWRIDESTWELFCKTCTNLKLFDWIVVPYTTSFFEIFGRYPKPQLEKLTFSTAMDWDWDEYYRSMNRTRPASGCAATATNAHMALKSCPALKDLEVAVYLPGDGGSDDNEQDDFGFLFGGVFGEPERRAGVPHEPMMNQEIFGDDFFETLATHCKQLEKLTIWRVVEGSTVNHTILSFTDRAMQAIATLPLLRWAELKSVNATGDGLFSLVAGLAPYSEYSHHQREFVITMGDQKGTATDMKFYDGVDQFLNKMLTTPGDKLPCASRRVALRLHNGRLQAVDRTWSESYLARVRQLAREVMILHPTVRIRVLTRGFRHGRESITTDGTCINTADSFEEVVEFGFYTVHTTINEWWGWVDEPQDTRIDDVVLNRGPLGRDGVQASTAAYRDDSDDDDDEYDDYGDEGYDPYAEGGDFGYDDGDD